MKILYIAFVVIVFNISMSLVGHSMGEVVKTNYYESSVMSKAAEMGVLNASANSPAQQAQMSLDIFDIVKDTITFDWMWAYVPGGREGTMAPFFGWLQAGMVILMSFLLAVSVLEFFMQTSGVMDS